MKSVLTPEKVCFLKYQDKKMCSALFSDFLLLPLPPHCPSWNKGRNIFTENFHYQPSFSKCLLFSDFQIGSLYGVPYYIKQQMFPIHKEILETVFYSFAHIYFLALRDKVLRTSVPAISCTCWSQCSPTAAHNSVCRMR